LALQLALQLELWWALQLALWLALQLALQLVGELAVEKHHLPLLQLSRLALRLARLALRLALWWALQLALRLELWLALRLALQLALQLVLQLVGELVGQLVGQLAPRRYHTPLQHRAQYRQQRAHCFGQTSHHRFHETESPPSRAPLPMPILPICRHTCVCQMPPKSTGGHRRNGQKCLLPSVEPLRGTAAWQQRADVTTWYS